MTGGAIAILTFTFHPDWYVGATVVPPRTLGGQEVASLQSSGSSPSRSPERLPSKLTLHAGLRGIQETSGQVGTYI